MAGNLVPPNRLSIQVSFAFVPEWMREELCAECEAGLVEPTGRPWTVVACNGKLYHEFCVPAGFIVAPTDYDAAEELIG